MAFGGGETLACIAWMVGTGEALPMLGGAFGGDIVELGVPTDSPPSWLDSGGVDKLIIEPGGEVNGWSGVDIGGVFSSSKRSPELLKSGGK
jgi:hypothetical protein